MEKKKHIQSFNNGAGGRTDVGTVEEHNTTDRKLGVPNCRKLYVTELWNSPPHKRNFPLLF